jgi:hypothetical protein
MGSRTGRRLRRLLGGSVVDAVQRSGLAPVVVVPAPLAGKANAVLRPRLQQA